MSKVANIMLLEAAIMNGDKSDNKFLDTNISNK